MSSAYIGAMGLARCVATDHPDVGTWEEIMVRYMPEPGQQVQVPAAVMETKAAAPAMVPTHGPISRKTGRPVVRRVHVEGVSCRGVNKQGRPCCNARSAGLEFCGHHKGQATDPRPVRVGGDGPRDVEVHVEADDASVTTPMVESTIAPPTVAPIIAVPPVIREEPEIEDVEVSDAESACDEPVRVHQAPAPDKKRPVKAKAPAKVEEPEEEAAGGDDLTYDDFRSMVAVHGIEDDCNDEAIDDESDLDTYYPFGVYKSWDNAEDINRLVKDLCAKGYMPKEYIEPGTEGDDAQTWLVIVR